MTSIIDVFQPITHMISIFHHVWLIGFVGIGVWSAFNIESFIFAGILSVLLIILSSLAHGVISYVFAILLGFAMGNIVKFVGQRLLGFY